MDTADAGEKFMAYCRNRGLQPKALDYYAWVLSKLMRVCPDLPTDAVQIATAYQDPALSKKSSTVSQGTRP